MYRRLMFRAIGALRGGGKDLGFRTQAEGTSFKGVSVEDKAFKDSKAFKV